MNPHGRFTLHPEVVIKPSGDPPTEFVVFRRGARIGGRGIGITLYRLLCHFREPLTILDAVVAHAEEENADPEEILADAWASLWLLIRSGVLVDAEGEWGPLRQRLRIGDLVHQVRILECVRVMEDFQVYRGELSDGRQVAMKLAAPGHEAAVRLLARERDLLAHLGGAVSPSLEGLFDEPGPALVSNWCAGVTLAKWLKGDRADRLLVASRIAHAYKTLHACGVLHVDANLNNVIVGPDSVRLIDFAGAVWVNETQTIPRYGVLAFQEPEYVSAVRAGSQVPAPSASGEQYSVGCLLYQVLIGGPPIRVGSDRAAAAHDLSTLEPRAFSDHGVFDLGRVEAVILRSLSKAPLARFGSLGELAQALDEAVAEIRPRARLVGGVRNALIQSLSPGGAWYDERFPGRPRSSVNSGAGGVSLALLELAIEGDDDRLLRLATEWLSRARAWAERPDAFLSEESPRLSEIVADGVSVLHTDLGLTWVEVLLRDAGSGVGPRDASVRDLKLRCDRPFTNFDLALGRSGDLAAAASVLARTGAVSVRSLGNQLLEEITRFALARAPIGQDASTDLNLGMAHGWAGVLWAVSLWRRAAGEPLDPWVTERAHQLLGRGRVASDGALSWPWHMPGRDAFVPGWCNGAAGFVLAYCELAVASADGDQWLRVAERAGSTVLSARWGAGHLCCGAAGAVYALARLHQVTGDPRWLAGAVRARDTALSYSGRHAEAASLFKGDVGLLLIDVDAPLVAGLSFPGFGPR